MNTHSYTPVRAFKRQSHFVQYLTTNFEPFLLSLLVITGIVGSVYLFGQKLIIGETSSMSAGNASSPSLAGIFLDEMEAESSDIFDEYVRVADKKKAGEPLEIEFLKDPKASRYVMEMGDGVRLIVTQTKLIYTYETPGKYVIELKEIKNGLLSLVGTRKIKIK
jgi:hypothetical protein